MGKNKLRKFSEMDSIDFVVQCPWSRLQQEGGCELKGHWHEQFFKNSNPIVLELGCGKGEYTVGLARWDRTKNYIGVDIKGARMWTGATQARDEKLTNVGFLRTDIELLPYFFAPGEVSEIWITFPDPQMKKVRKRLTSTRFLELYRQVTSDGALIHLKSDSPFLYTYTSAMLDHNGITPMVDIKDLYSAPLPSPELGIRTHYESQWIDRGLTIKYLRFALPHDGELTEPDIEIPFDTYRSYSRGQIQCPELCGTDGAATHPSERK